MCFFIGFSLGLTGRRVARIVVETAETDAVGARGTQFRDSLHPFGATVVRTVGCSRGCRKDGSYERRTDQEPCRNTAAHRADVARGCLGSRATRSSMSTVKRAGVSLSGMKSRAQRGRRRLAELFGQCCALTLDGRIVPLDYEPPSGCGCAEH